MEHSGILQDCVKSAEDQFISMKDWITKLHGDILNGWTYAAVGCFTKIPREKFDQSYKQHFYISKSDYMDKDGFSKWWKGFLKDVIGPPPNQTDAADHSYSEFMNRLTG